VALLGARIRIALTGGIGSGKSTVGGLLQHSGATLVDADAISHRITAAGGAAIPALLAAFGPGVLTAHGALDRDAMRTIAFADTAARARLEAVLHPMIGAAALNEAAAAPTRVVIFDVPLLAESSAWRARVDRVLVVDCTEPTQLARVTARPGWTSESAQRAIAAQASRAKRRTVADAVIFNDGIELPTLREEVLALWRTWLAEPVEQ
jgi:dephospho-CoA kinase